MKRLFAAVFALPLAFAAPATHSQTGDLAAVSAHLKAVSSMRAGFKQIDDKGRVLNGTLTLKRPGKIRFEYQKGTPILIVGDGKALVFVDYGVKQVQRWPIKNTPLGVLLDPDRDLTRYARIMPQPDPRIVIAETRDPKHPEYGTITLAMYRSDSAPGGLMLQGWIAVDNQRRRTEIRLSGHQFNMPVSDKAFLWSDPRSKSPVK